MSLNLLSLGTRRLLPQPSQNFRICLPEQGRPEQGSSSLEVQLGRGWKERLECAVKPIDRRRGTHGGASDVRRRLAVNGLLSLRVLTALDRVMDPLMRSGEGDVLQRYHPLLEV